MEAALEAADVRVGAHHEAWQPMLHASQAFASLLAALLLAMAGTGAAIANDAVSPVSLPGPAQG